MIRALKVYTTERYTNSSLRRCARPKARSKLSVLPPQLGFKTSRPGDPQSGSRISVPGEPGLPFFDLKAAMHRSLSRAVVRRS